VAPSVDSLMAGARHALEATALELERVHGKHWDARVEVIRNVVSVCAVVLAGTIAFLEKDPPRTTTLKGAFLISSWLLLVASLAFGLYVLWQSVTLRSFYPKLFNSQLYLIDQFSQLDLSQPDVVHRSAAILKRVTDSVVNPIGFADRAAQWVTLACMGSFGTSMVCLLIYALFRAGIPGQ
jgi:hypothetical protein